MNQYIKQSALYCGISTLSIRLLTCCPYKFKRTLASYICCILFKVNIPDTVIVAAKAIAEIVLSNIFTDCTPGIFYLRIGTRAAEYLKAPRERK